MIFSHCRIALGKAEKPASAHQHLLQQQVPALVGMHGRCSQPWLRSRETQQQRTLPRRRTQPGTRQPRQTLIIPQAYGAMKRWRTGCGIMALQGPLQASPSRGSCKAGAGLAQWAPLVTGCLLVRHNMRTPASLTRVYKSGRCSCPPHTHIAVLHRTIVPSWGSETELRYHGRRNPAR